MILVLDHFIRLVVDQEFFVVFYICSNQSQEAEMDEEYLKWVIMYFSCPLKYLKKYILNYKLITHLL
jgi:hypothetical protein